MNTKCILTKAFALAALSAIPLAAQSHSAVRLQVAPGTQLSFEGTSTLHGFTCTTTSMQAYIDVDTSYQTANLATLAHPIVAVQVVIPISSLACGGELEGNMRKTLNATKYPYIIYKLSTYDVVPGTASASGFTLTAQGTVSVAGSEHPITLTVKASRTAAGAVSATGSETIKMTDFGIKPPTFMFGTLRAGNDLKVKFTVNATSEAVASAISELGIRLAAARPAASVSEAPQK